MSDASIPPLQRHLLINGNNINPYFVIVLRAEDEGSRIKGRRMSLSDINGNGLKWRPFNGSWINGESRILFPILHTTQILRIHFVLR